MNEFWPEVIGRQFAAAIQMVRSAVEVCPEELWDDRTRGTPFWHLAYHTLFYADFYLSDDAEMFQARDFHVDQANFLPGNYAGYGGVVETPARAFTRTQLREYADHCLQKSEGVFRALTDGRARERCGFPWYELNVGEFLLNSLRHTQHHAGQLAVLLRREAGTGIEWLGTKDNRPPPATW